MAQGKADVLSGFTRVRYTNKDMPPIGGQMREALIASCSKLDRYEYRTSEYMTYITPISAALQKF